jgi:tetratricopeptide (TPR) repeat protein
MRPVDACEDCGYNKPLNTPRVRTEFKGDFHRFEPARFHRHSRKCNFMKKKLPQKVKQSSSKSKKTVDMKSAGTTGKLPAAQAPPKVAAKPDPRFTQAVQNYEAGLKAMQTHKFDKAKAALTKVLEGPSKELADRARVHLNTCNQQLGRIANTFRTPEEHYDYAVSLMNSGDYDGSRTHLDKLLKQYPKADYAAYGMAVLDSLTNRVEDCLRNLQHAIKLNPSNRFQARNDSDFAQMADDPRFTELLYPESEGQASATSAGTKNRH